MEVRPHEQRLIQLAADLPGGNVLCNTAGRGQLAAALAGRSGSTVTCWFLDLYQLQQSQLAIGRLPARLQLVCEADPPPGELNAVALCISRQGDAELTRELLQAGHQRLAIGGRLAAAIDNPADQWLHELLRGMYDKVTRRPSKDTVVYLATKTRPLKKIKDYACEFALRDGPRLIHLRTRPGVFSHREVDGGARALVKSMEVQPGARVLDLGCGSGAVGIAAALRAESVSVHATDSNPRAIEAVRWAAERNGVANFTAALDCDGSSVQPGAFDLVLANPPYFSNFQIAGLFVAIAQRALRVGGKLLVVTKTPQWYPSALSDAFGSIAGQIVGKFHVVSGVRS
jgi:16S rRNA (guanine1207-N2)-methyltransferase